MAGAHIFVIIIRKNMDKKSKRNIYNKGEMHFGMEVLLFIVAIFILWVLVGGNKKQIEQKPFITPLNDEVAPGRTYNPGE